MFFEMFFFSQIYVKAFFLFYPRFFITLFLPELQLKWSKTCCIEFFSLRFLFCQVIKGQSRQVTASPKGAILDTWDTLNVNYFAADEV